jgi:hypothetical protein
MADKLALIPEQVWAPAVDADGAVRDGAWVAEVTGLLDLSSWPAGMRVIVRKERPHPGAQLRITDVDGNRVTAFATNTTGGQLPDLELRHRRRARAEDRIRVAKDTGLTNLPLHGLDQNRIWCALVCLAVELTAWAQLLALPGQEARRWEPKRLRLRLLSIPGRLAVSGRQPCCTCPPTPPGPGSSSTRSTCSASPTPAPPPADHEPPCPDEPQEPLGPWKPTPTRAPPDEPSHPPGTVTTQSRRSTPAEPQRPTGERSGLGAEPRSAARRMRRSLGTNARRRYRGRARMSIPAPVGGFR